MLQLCNLLLECCILIWHNVWQEGHVVGKGHERSLHGHQVRLSHSERDKEGERLKMERKVGGGRRERRKAGGWMYAGCDAG